MCNAKQTNHLLKNIFILKKCIPSSEHAINLNVLPLFFFLYSAMFSVYLALPLKVNRCCGDLVSTQVCDFVLLSHASATCQPAQLVAVQMQQWE